MQSVQYFFDRYIFKIKPGIFRLFLAILVVLSHGIRIFHPFGAFAVCTFFILSGYWVAKMYNEFYLKKHNSYWLFIYSRVLRLFPLYWLCTILMLITCKLLIYFYNINVLPSINFFQAAGMILLLPLNLIGFKFLNPAWSLAVEMQFYIIAPLLIWLIKKMNGYLLGFIILALSIYFSLIIEYKTNETVLPYLIYFFIGMIIFQKKLEISKVQMIFSFILILLFILISFCIPIFRQAILYDGLVYNSIQLLAIFTYTLPFLFVPFIINNLKQKSDKLDRQYGDFSYTIYLVHWIVFKVYYQFYDNGGFSSSKMVGFIITIATVFILSLIIYLFFEKKVEKWRKAIIQS